MKLFTVWPWPLTFTAAMTTYHVHVITGTEFGSGTNANVFVKLYGDKDQTGIFFCPKFSLPYEHCLNYDCWKQLLMIQNQKFTCSTVTKNHTEWNLIWFLQTRFHWSRLWRILTSLKQDMMMSLCWRLSTLENCKKLRKCWYLYRNFPESRLKGFS